MILERSDEKTPFELGVCAQKKRLHEPLIDAFLEHSTQPLAGALSGYEPFTLPGRT
ncbi:DNA-binding transcriptional regulator IlvY [Leclercia adecarboxylata]|uniref:DNA-binding transcriptional regulator IlvY n=1 Tax=Leclercia adecarboxylata TaxID=83655 RepID=A0A4V6JM61_9ENTR|nr:DNA-binding transcriptional regulator IlvY [Leclercia adecarboxylata]